MVEVALADKESDPRRLDKPSRRAQAPGPNSQVLTGQAVPIADVQLALQDPGLSRPAGILALQHAAGNRAVSRLIQARLTVGPAGDRYEQEADRVAEQVMTAAAPAQAERQPVRRQEEEEIHTRPLAASITPLVQRQEDEDEIQTAPLVQRQEDEDEIQTRPDPQDGFEAGPEIESRLSALKGGGSALPDEVRAVMEPRFGTDFSDVKVHADAGAAQMNRQLQAQAFTHGRDIYMGAGRYEPGTDAGKRLLAHELTHVVQQTGGQDAAQPAAEEAVRRRPRMAEISASLLSIRRSLVKEATRAFGTVGADRQHVDPLADPDDPAYTYGQLAQATNDLIPTGEQSTLVNVRPLVETRRKSPEHEKRLKDVVRAHILGQYAKRLSELPAKYPELATRKAKRKVYWDKAQFDRQRGQGLVAKGRASAEAKTWLDYTGLADLVPQAPADSVEARNAAGVRPRIDVRATSFGNKRFKLQFAFHVFIIYTDTNGQEYLIRGGPGDAQPGAPHGYVTGNFEQYHPEHPDWDPSAQSITVMQGPQAAARLDAMIETALSLEKAQVPYSAGEGIGEIAENCNTAAWTILTRAGVPTRAPGHGQVGWGHILGQKTPGKQAAMPRPETTDGPGKPRLIGDPGAPVFQDRQGIEKKGDLAAGLAVTWLDRTYYDYGDTDLVKIKYQGNEIGFVHVDALDLVPVPGRWVHLDKSANLVDPETDEVTDNKLRAGTAVQVLDADWSPGEFLGRQILIRYRAGNRLREAKVYEHRLPGLGWGAARKRPKQVEGAPARRGFFGARGVVPVLRHCPHCDGWIVGNLDTCPHCGAQQYCASCHAELEPFMKFCGSCGTPTPWAQAEAEGDAEPQEELEAAATVEASQDTDETQVVPEQALAAEQEQHIDSPFIDESEVETRENMGTGGRQTLPEIMYGVGVSFDGVNPRLEFGRTFTGFFKTERPEERKDVALLIEHYGINRNNPEVARRNLATFRLNQLLGADVIPPSFVAKHRGQVGFVSEKVEGTHGDETGKAELQNPLVRQALSRLYMLDMIAGQIDRHGHNWIVEKRDGVIVGVKGIDNDYGFGEALTGETLKEEEAMGPNAWMRGIRGKLGRELTEIDEPFATRIISLAHDVDGELHTFLDAFQDLLTEGEIAAMHSRLQALAGFLEPLMDNHTGVMRTNWNA